MARGLVARGLVARGLVASKPIGDMGRGFLGTNNQIKLLKKYREYRTN